MTRFIHTADLHIDSPLKGVALRDESTMQQLQKATRTALERIVNLAISREVAFVLIAGDLFDGDWRDMRSGQWVAAQFRRLQEAEIGVYYIRGNHDAVSQVERRIRWPDNVVELSNDEPETRVLDDLGIAIHGQGFLERSVTHDLAATYPAAISGLFNIGMLHTSLTGSEQHDAYAPTSLDVLRGKQYDYWALGHIHLRPQKPLSVEPYITYSGNPQGRHIREPGAKGCLLVETDGPGDVQVEFHTTDSIRWEELVVDISSESSVDGVLARAGSMIAAAHAPQGDRGSVFRISFEGSSPAHFALSDLLQRGAIEEQLTEIANLHDGVALERIRFHTTAPSQDSSSGHELWSCIAAQFEVIREDPHQQESLRQLVRPALEKVSAAGVSLSDDGGPDERMEQWIAAAERLLQSRLGVGDL